MQPTSHRLIATATVVIMLIALSAAFFYRGHVNIGTVIPLSVSLSKYQYKKGETVAINVSVSNPLHREIFISQLSFGLAACCGHEGFYINDDKIRYKYAGHYISDIGVVSGILDLTLQPGQSINNIIMLPDDNVFTVGSHEIAYELRIPFYGSENHFCLAPRKVVTIYLDPRDRPIADVWRDRVQDRLNGNGEFVVRGKLEFIVK